MYRLNIFLAKNLYFSNINYQQLGNGKPSPRTSKRYNHLFTVHYTIRTQLMNFPVDIYISFTSISMHHQSAVINFSMIYAVMLLMKVFFQNRLC